jgi:hypothetical protein
MYTSTDFHCVKFVKTSHSDKHCTNFTEFDILQKPYLNKFARFSEISQDPTINGASVDPSSEVFTFTYYY